MVSALAVKDTAHEAWEAIRMMRVGVNRVREATAQHLRKEFEQISFKNGESLNAFGMRITGIVNNLRSLGDTVEEIKVVQKFLCEVPSQSAQIACAIETLLDLDGMSVEELIGRLRSVSERCSTTTTDAGGQILLTEQEWATRGKQRNKGTPSGSKNGGKGKQQQGRDGGQRAHEPSGDRDWSKVKCYNCNKFAGHISKNCPEPQGQSEPGT